MRFSIREARLDDEVFLSDMLYEAAAWRPGPRHSSRDELLSLPEIAVYLRDWGQSGDVGVVAEGETGDPIGASWYRTFAEDAPGFGFVGPEIPELTLAVREGARRRGVGTALLDELIAEAKERGVAALSLSVEPDNPAVRLYERASFRVIAADSALTMVLDLD